MRGRRSAVLGLAGLPAGWLSGAIVGVSAAALSGRPMFVPPQVGRVVYVHSRYLARLLGDARDCRHHGDLAAQHAGADDRDGRRHRPR